MNYPPAKQADEEVRGVDAHASDARQRYRPRMRLTD
jgi:hypothetical protein